MSRTERATMFMPVPPGAVQRVLQDPLRMAEWNPAFLAISGPSQALVGNEYALRVRPGLPGRFRYTLITDSVIGTAWEVPGLFEEGTWRIASHGEGLRVTHSFTHSGPLAQALRHAFVGVATLRLQRLSDRASVHAPRVPKARRGAG